jgi:hypothetical protein
MKKIEKLKLNQFSMAELNQRRMNMLRGGSSCESMCACVCSSGDPLDGNYCGGGNTKVSGADYHL